MGRDIGCLAAAEGAGGRRDWGLQHPRWVGRARHPRQADLKALTLAIEKQSAAAGLLGCKLKFFRHDPQSSMQMYAQFAHQAALKGKVAVVC